MARSGVTVRRVVYTAVIGDYERLNEQPVAAHSDIPFICLTDSPSLVSETWKVQLVEPFMSSDPIRSARRLKILGHPLLDAEESLWIDNSVVLRERPEVILDTWLDSADVAMPGHSFRERLIDEFDAVVKQGLDDSGRVFEQLRHYFDELPGVLDEQPKWTAILARRRTPPVEDFCATWFTHVLRYSRRDQLSVLAALHWSSPELRSWSPDIDNHSSALHEWPVTVRRDRSGPARNPLEALQPLAARVRELELRLGNLEGELRHRMSQLAAWREHGASLLDSVAERERSLLELAPELERWRAEAVAAATRIDQMEASRSWRIGQRLARLARPLAALRRLRSA